MKVLIVDDEIGKREDFKRDLYDAGIRADILEASDAMTGLRIYSENQDINYVVTDLEMSLMNGHDFILRLLNEGYDERILVNSNSSRKIFMRDGLGDRVELDLPEGNWDKRIDFLRKYFGRV